jgi:glycosyltransferase involved in cell wall biosynthesis
VDAGVTSGGRITFYCGPSIEPWGPDSLWTGIGGSEEAAIHMSRQFARLGWQVDVFANPPGDRPLIRDGVRWIPFRDFDPDRPGDVFVAWCDAGFVNLGRRHRVACHWLHNRQDWPYDEDVAAKVDRILLVSHDHARDPGFAGVDPRKLYCSSNGLDEDFLRPGGDNQPHRVIYASCPARGLTLLLEMWPAIRRRVPDAALDVYHGFTAIYDDMARAFPGLGYIKALVYQLIDQEGVTFHGMVGQDKLAEGFARAGVWAYPTECRETSCITAMKALAMGCLPVTTGYGALGETLGGYDLGPVNPTKPISRWWWRRRSFFRRLVRAMKDGGSPAARARRRAGAAWARQRYAWPAIAQDWRRLFAEIDQERRR